MSEAVVLRRSRRAPQICAAFGATVGAFGLGTVLGWSSPALPSIEATGEFVLTDGDRAWLGAIAALGALVSCPVAGGLAEKIGRKRTMLSFSVPFLSGWFMIAFANSLVLMKIGRFLTGFAGASYFVTGPMYISEISDSEIRGFLGTCLSVMLAAGILFVYVVGSFISWSWLSIVCAGFPLLGAVILLFMPESPRYLLKKGRISDASRSLCWLRGVTLAINVDDELRQIQESILKSQIECGKWRDMVKLQTLKPTLICVLLLIIQQFSGINIITMYSVDLFRSAGTNIQANIASIILAIVLLCSVMLSSALIDYFGRRILLITSLAGMACGMLLVGLFFMLKGIGHGESFGVAWFPLVGLCTYIMSFSLGMSGIPLLLLGELLPPNTKGLTSGIATMISWLSGFTVIQLFGPVNHAVGQAWSYWILGIICIIGVVYVKFIVPETKGKDLDEIQIDLEKRNNLPTNPSNENDITTA